MKKSARLNQLRCHDLFSAFSARQWRELVPHLALRDLKPDTDLLLEANQDTFCILLDGRIKLYRITGLNGRRIVGMVRPGQSFADDGLFSDYPEGLIMAHMLRASLVAFIGRYAYLHLLRESFETSQIVMTRMAESIDAYSNELERLSLPSSLARVSHYLLHLATGADCKVLSLPSSKCAIARQLGLAPETLSRTLRTLIDQGLISVRGGIIEISDRGKLEQITNRSRSAGTVDDARKFINLSQNKPV